MFCWLTGGQLPTKWSLTRVTLQILHVTILEPSSLDDLRCHGWNLWKCCRGNPIPWRLNGVIVHWVPLNLLLGIDCLCLFQVTRPRIVVLIKHLPKLLSHSPRLQCTPLSWRNFNFCLINVGIIFSYLQGIAWSCEAAWGVYWKSMSARSSSIIRNI